MRPAIPEPLWQQWHDETAEIRLGISACLLGWKVRYDGGHKHDRYLTDVLGRWVSWVPVCPEVDLGLGTPRPTIRLEAAGAQPRLVMPSTGEDLTERMETYASAKVDELRGPGLDGYVLKRASPSCGMERVRVWAAEGSATRNGVGAYARILMERWPHLPVEEEGRLNDPVLRENFIERVFCRHRWRALVRRGLDRGTLAEFHTAHKLLLRSHNEAACRRLGRLVASADTISDRELFRRYEAQFHHALRSKTTGKRHANVLYHALGLVKKHLTPFEKQEAVGLIEDYRKETVPWVVPVTLLRHHAAKHGVVCLQKQLYLEPHPKELMLRNRV
ncbi:MAG: DUF1722 domain-containing protein [bacterium]|nr:DUF1722 domain-containing protein [bacterium]